METVPELQFLPLACFRWTASERPVHLALSSCFAMTSSQRRCCPNRPLHFPYRVICARGCQCQSTFGHAESQASSVVPWWLVRSLEAIVIDREMVEGRARCIKGDRVCLLSICVLARDTAPPPAVLQGISSTSAVHGTSLSHPDPASPSRAAAHLLAFFAALARARKFWCGGCPSISLQNNHSTSTSASTPRTPIPCQANHPTCTTPPEQHALPPKC